MKGTRSLRLGMLIAAFAAAIGCQQTGSREVPPRQPPLVTLSQESFQGLRTDFNRDRDRGRIILLLSPT
jgi:hypothetical protein